MRQAIDQMATDAGRDPSSIGCIVRANIHLVDGAADTPYRPPFSGTMSQISADVRHCEDIGVDEVFIDGQFSPGGDQPTQSLDHLEHFAGLTSQPILS